MKLKKLIALPLLAVLAALLLMGATSCDILLHEHSFSEWETVTAPTCTSFGLEKRECECGLVEYDTTEALPHTTDVDPSVDATCDAAGRTEGAHCSVCGAVISKQDDTAKTSHTYSAWETVSAATCTSIGLEKRECECGFIEYRTLGELGHTAVTDAALAAGCTEAGKTEGSHCATCGDVLVCSEDVPALGHSLGDAIVTLEASCNADGTKRYSCTNEGCEYYYEESYALAPLDSTEIFIEAIKYTGTLETYDQYGNPIFRSTAFLLSSDGKIACSAFAIDNASVAVFTLGGVEYEVTDVLAYSEESCIAILKINATDLPYAVICESEPLTGETIYIIGAPDGFVDSLSVGVISNAKRELKGANFIQHDADMSRGYVGGPLLNRFGEVIGINAGYIGDSSLNLSTWVSEVDKLDYSSPMTMSEYGQLSYTVPERLSNWVLNNVNAYGTNTVAYAMRGTDFYYSIAYDSSYGFVYLQSYWLLEGTYQLYASFVLDSTSGTYQYYTTLSDGSRMNEAYGFIDAATYTADTVIEYDTYYGRYWTESDVMGLYKTAIFDTLVWFDYYLDTYFYDITLETFGFTSIVIDRDEDAIDKLDSFVKELGVENTETGEYSYLVAEQLDSDVAYFNIAHKAADGENPASTVVTLHYYTGYGEMYVVSLELNPGEDGNRFEVYYGVYDGVQYTAQNYGWGYLDSSSFTNMSALSCYVFDGFNEYEDALLASYASLLNYMLGKLDGLMAGISPELGIADLGFYFYFG